jgi:hypothetical protein
MTRYDAQNQPADLFDRYGLYARYDASSQTYDRDRARSRPVRQARRTQRAATPKGSIVGRRLWIVGLLELLYIIFFILAPAMQGAEMADGATGGVLGFLFFTALGTFATSFLVWFARRDDESGGVWSRNAHTAFRLGLPIIGTTYLAYKGSVGVARHLHRVITKD